MQLCPSCAIWECSPEDLFCGHCGESLRRLDAEPKALPFVGAGRTRALTLLVKNAGLACAAVRVGQSRTSREWLKVTHPEESKARVKWTRSMASVEDGQLLPPPHFDAHLELDPGAEYHMEVAVSGRVAAGDRPLMGSLLLATGDTDPDSTRGFTLTRVPVTWGPQPKPHVELPPEVNARLGSEQPLELRIKNGPSGCLTLRGTVATNLDWVRVIDEPTGSIGPGEDGLVHLVVDGRWAPPGTHRLDVSVSFHEVDTLMTATTTVQVRPPPVASIDRSRLSFGDLTPFSEARAGFALENKGEEDLVLQGDPTVEPRTLAPFVRIEDDDPSNRRLRASRGTRTLKDLRVVVRARGLDPGAYEGRVVVVTNDPARPVAHVPFTFTVRELAPTDRVLAMDFGTSNCCVAVALDMGHFEALDLSADRRGVVELPTVIHYPAAGLVVVGDEARNLELGHPERTVSSIKRRLGTTRPLKVAGQEREPWQVASDIMRVIWERTAVALGEKPGEIVLTTPCRFGQLAVENLLRAAREAGFKPHAQTLDEPSAAAFRYCILNREELEAAAPRHHILVYDFGGGTLDVALLELTFATSPRTKIRVLDVGGMDLGGDDLDEALVTLYIERLREDQRKNPRTKLARVDLDRVATVRDGEADLNVLANVTVLRRTAEAVKKALSRQDSVDIPPMRLKDRDSGSVSLTPEDTFLTVTRVQFEGRIRNFLESSLEVVDRVLLKTRIPRTDIGLLLLTGGSSQMPLVRSLMGGAFPGARIPAAAEVEPKSSVALGAVVHAYLKQFEAGMHSMEEPEIVIEPMREQVQFAIGTASALGQFTAIIPRGSLPNDGTYPMRMPRATSRVKLVRHDGTQIPKLMEPGQLREVGHVELDPGLFPDVTPGTEITLRLFLSTERKLLAELNGQPLPVHVKEDRLR